MTMLDMAGIAGIVGFAVYALWAVLLWGTKAPVAVAQWFEFLWLRSVGHSAIGLGLGGGLLLAGVEAARIFGGAS